MTLRRKLILWGLVAIVATVLGRLFLNSPIANLQLAAETVGNDIFGRWDLTNSIIAAWITMGVLVLLAWLGTRRMAMVPRGIQNFVEATVEAILNIVEDVAGRRNGRRFFPVVATIFLFILVGNWLALTPIFGTIGKVDTAEFLINEEIDDAVDTLKDEHPELTAELDRYLDEVERNMDEHGRDAPPPPPPEAIRPLIVQEVRSEIGGDRMFIFDGEDNTFIVELGFNKAKEIGLAEYWDFDRWQARSGEVVSGENTVNLDGKTVGVLLPFLRNPNTDLMVTLAIALVAMGFVEYWGTRALGFRGYTSRFLDLKHGPVGFFVGMLEAISEGAKLISFSFRLLGNMFAGEVLIFSFLFLLPIMAAVFIFPFLLEVFVGFIQAVIFAALTLIFAVNAVTSHEGPHETASEGGAQQ